MTSELAIGSSAFYIPVIEIVSGNDSFNQFFTLVFGFGGVAYYCGVFVDILRASR